MKALIPGLIFLISIISAPNAALFKSDVAGSGKSSQSSGSNLQKLPDLPVIITSAKTENLESPVAVIISGDGGWYKFEQSIADKLSLEGIPTIGLDTKNISGTGGHPRKLPQTLLHALIITTKSGEETRSFS